MPFDTIRMGSSAAGAYEIEKSLRFNSADSATLTRTFGTPTNTDKYTFSCWLKRTKFHDSAGHFGLLGNDGWSVVRFTADRLYWRENGIVNITTTRKWRDPSSWYHIVLRYDSSLGTAADRAQIWVNGVRETDFTSASYPSQNQNSFINSAIAQVLGGYRTNEQFIDGYLADINFVDGQGLDPDNFGETDTDTGQWIPKKYEGTYGDNGYHLKFDDTSALGTDSSGEGNNWTPNNFSVSAGVGNDSVTDTPTNNYATLTPLKGYDTTFVTPTNGNLDYDLSGTTSQTFSSTAVGPSGKWYVEITATDAESGRYGLQTPEHTAQFDEAFAVIPQSDVRVIKRGSSEIYTSITSISDGDIIGIALDCDNNTAQAYMNGTSLGNAFSLDSVAPDKIYHLKVGRNSSGGGSPAGSVNFGQRAFSHQPSTDFKAWNTANLSTPTIKDGTKHFNTLLYEGNSTDARAITGVGFGPNLVWIKNRDDTDWHNIYDTVRGAGKRIAANSTSAESNSTDHMDSIDSDGFTLKDGDNTNQNGESYLSWNWLAGGSSTSSNSDGTITSTVSVNSTAGFSIVSYAGTGSAGATVGHGLGTTPDVIIIKNRTDSQSDGGSYWSVYNSSMFNSAADCNIMYLNETNAPSDDTNIHGTSVTINSTVFSLGDYNGTNGSSDNMIAYCFSNVEGYCKSGTYSGNNNSNGPYIYTGFKPAWLLIKGLINDDWAVFDNKRDPYNLMTRHMRLSTSATEYVASGSPPVELDFTSNGFKHRNSNGQINGSNTYFYLAFAETPFKYATAR